MKQPLSRTFFFLLLLHACTASAGAQTPTPTPAPQKTNAAEKPKSGQAAKQMLTAAKLDDYRPMLLEPVAELIENKLLLAKVMPSVDFVWELAETWNAATQANGDRFAVAKNGELSGAPAQRFERGLPFPVQLQIQSEPSDVLKAYKILWNAVHMESIPGDLMYDAQFTWVGAQSVMRSARGTIYRLWPDISIGGGSAAAPSPLAALPPAATPTPDPNKLTVPEPIPAAEPSPAEQERDLMLELVHFHSPPVVLGLAQILKRCWGSAEDEFWIYSPVIGKSRHVDPALRGDKLLDGVLTGEDLFVWSGKIPGSSPRLVGERELLVAFPSNPVILLEEHAKAPVRAGEIQALPPAARSADQLPNASAAAGALHGRGPYSRSDGTPTTTQWNFETQQYTGFGLWNPTSVIFAPRKVWIIELWPSGPFADVGRQILVIDQQTLLPVYKLVYDRRGQLVRTVIGGWGLAQSKNGKVVFPYPAFVAAVSPDGRDAVVVSVDEIATFLGVPKPGAQRIRSLLDIKQHGSQEKEKSEKGAAAPGKDQTPVPTEPATPLPEETAEPSSELETTPEAEEQPPSEGEAIRRQEELAPSD